MLEKFSKFLKEEISKIKKMKLSDLRKALFRVLKRLPDVVHLRHLVFFSLVFSVAIFILFTQGFAAFNNYRNDYNPNFGGTYKEGVVGNIQRINPIYAAVNPAERDASKLVFAGLTKIDEKGAQKGDLAKEWKISNDGKVYEFKLRENLKWHDGRKISSDDVLFTINAIQNPDSRSNLFNTWKGVKAEKIDNLRFKFTLDKPLASFITATDVGILPKHLLEKVPAQNLKVAQFNQDPIGSGPFIFKRIDNKKNYTEVTLAANKDYYEKKPYISTFKIRTYPNEYMLLEGYLKKEVQAVSRISYDNLNKAKKLKGISFYTRFLPEYTALFFNEKSQLFKEKELRKILAASIDGKDLKALYDGNVTLVNSPVTAGFNGRLIKKENPKSEKDLAHALDELGWKLDGKIRKKDGKELAISVVTGDSEEYKKTGKYLSEKFRKLGIKVNLEVKNFVDLQQNNIRPRKYDVLLYTQSLGKSNDLFSYWHSSNKNDPGLNFSVFGDIKVDKYLEIARESMDEKKNEEMLVKAQEIINENKPAAFLYIMPYIYGVSANVKGVKIDKIKDPSDRFYNVANWFLIEE